MNANEVIDSYVRDVARCLPRKKRNDVAFELRALLADDLTAKAKAEGRAADRAMAMALLEGFGRPAEAARRYHDRPALIDAADTHHFVIWALGGAVAIGVLAMLGVDRAVDDDLFLKWLGVLVILFALMGWWRRRNPGVLGWKPTRGPDSMHRGLAVLAMVATLVFPVLMYAVPQIFVQVGFLGAVSTGGLDLTEAFLQSGQRGATLALLVASATIYAVVAVQGGWRAWTRWASIAVHAGLGALFMMHTVPMASADGGTFPVFESATANAVATPVFGAIGAIFVLGVLYEIYREWARIRPAPALETSRAS